MPSQEAGKEVADYALTWVQLAEWQAIALSG
jgi:hypothetical protein